jgi:Lysozyme like domain
MPAAYLTWQDLAKVALSQWQKGPATTAVAIARAESGGNINALNSTPPDLSYGLWQINMLGQLGVNRRAQFGLSTNDELYDPWTNARVAHAISAGGTNWAPWSVYKSGAYQKFMSQATEYVDWILAHPEYLYSGPKPDFQGPIVHDPQPGDVVVKTPLEMFFEFITKAETWRRVALFVGGGVLLIVGLTLWFGNEWIKYGATALGKALRPAKNTVRRPE